ncbi:MAG: hypothetical protein R3F10_02545 [Lysobacteraceae bacterium]
MFLWLLLLIPGCVFVLGIRKVPEDTVFTVHRFGRFLRNLAPGLHWTIPLLDRISHRTRMVGHRVSLPAQPLHDGAAAQAAVYYQIMEPARIGDALNQVDALVLGEASACLAALADQAPANDAAHELAGELKAELNRHLAEFGLLVTRCKLHLTAA